MSLPFFLRNFLNPIGMDLFEKRKGKGENLIRNRLSLFANKKLKKMHSKHTFSK